MIRRVFLFQPFLMGMLLSAACSPLQTPEPDASLKQLTDKDSGSTIVLRVGDTLELALEGNPTTGYSWEVAPGSETLLAPERGGGFKPYNNAPGSGGIITLRFAALRAGESSLKLIYHRPFEPNGSPLKTFEIRLVVNK